MNPRKRKFLKIAARNKKLAAEVEQPRPARPARRVRETRVVAPDEAAPEAAPEVAPEVAPEE